MSRVAWFRVGVCCTVIGLLSNLYDPQAWKLVTGTLSTFAYIWMYWDMTHTKSVSR